MEFDQQRKTLCNVSGVFTAISLTQQVAMEYELSDGRYHDLY
jgi:hypothetical protein